jgi:hypothetical protein
MRRCDWAESSLAEIAYHDEEWGVAVHDDRTHFEMLVLEGAQAGLSWRTVLLKREACRSLALPSSTLICSRQVWRTTIWFHAFEYSCVKA